MRPDAVIVPAITFLATANAARYVGAEVVFSDVDPSTGLMTDAHLEEAVRKAQKRGLSVKAAIPVHYAGQISDVYAAASHLGIKLIEDAAHATGSRHQVDEKTVIIGGENRSEATIFSFHPVKNITTGEGGAVLTNKRDIADKVRCFRNHGMIREPDKFLNAEQARTSGCINPWYYEMQELGFNYRLSDIHAALGITQLRKLDEIIDKRSKLVVSLDKALSRFSTVATPLRRVPTSISAWHLYVLLIDFEKVGKSRLEIMKLLGEQGVGTQVHYLPVYRQPYYANRYGQETLDGAEAFYSRALSLPL